MDKSDVGALAENLGNGGFGKYFPVECGVFGKEAYLRIKPAKEEGLYSIDVRFPVPEDPSVGIERIASELVKNMPSLIGQHPMNPVLH